MVSGPLRTDAAMAHVVPATPCEVKICGLTRPADARMAEAAGARYLGVIFAGGPRLVTEAQAAMVLGRPRAGVQRVGVFGAVASTEILGVADRLDLDVIQLHGDPIPEEVLALRRQTHRRLWPVLRVDAAGLPADAAALARAAGALVLDAKVSGQLGGTGVALDWAGLKAAVASLRHDAPEALLVLAGGIRPERVAQAMALITPDVLDVSSGVEVSPGVKDAGAVDRLLAAVAAFSEKAS